MSNFRKFPSIDQFKSVITNVRQYAKKHEKPLPCLRFDGTVKLHGTNGGIGYNPATDEIWAQSRERLITPFDDNAAFAKYAAATVDNWKFFLRQFVEPGERVVIFGEWAGESIQKGVGIAQVAKAFYPFEIRVYTEQFEGDDTVHSIDPMLYVDELKDIERCFPVGTFPTWSIDIDFNAPQEVQNKLVELTLAVEEKCPVAAEFGVEGIGEGIVWTNRETGLRFKVKGEKHSTSKVSTVKEISQEDLERLKTVKTFVDTVVTENRLNQGLDKLREMGKPRDVTSTGDYIKWIIGDVMKEEMDLIIASCLDKKELMPAMSQRAKEFYFAALKEVEEVV